MRIASFDIGFRNLSLAIETISNKSIKELARKYNLLNKKDKIIERHEHSPILQALLTDFYKGGKTDLLELIDLNRGQTCGLVISTRKHLDEYLSSRKKILEKCSTIIIEQQFKTGQACNFDAILLGEAVFSWCCFNLSVQVEYVPSRYKTSLMGMCRTVIETRENGLRTVRDIVKKDRKKWSVVKVREIFTIRNDNAMLELLGSHKKKDDLSDVILQAQSWVLKNYIM
jgi:hypothetical protein